MEQGNTMYKYFLEMEGAWSSEDGTCTASMNIYGNMEVGYADCKMSSSYSVHVITVEDMITPNMMLGMMAFVVPARNGEKYRFTFNNPTLYSGDQTLYRVSDAWYGTDDILHVEIMDLNDGNKIEFLMKKVAESGDTASGSAVSGVSGEESGAFVCQCGYKGVVRRFCPECGRAVDGE